MRKANIQEWVNGAGDVLSITTWYGYSYKPVNDKRTKEYREQLENQIAYLEERLAKEIDLRLRSVDNHGEKKWWQFWK